MTLHDFAAIAHAYQIVDNEFTDMAIVKKAFELLRDAYNALSPKDKEVVDVICDARVTDLFY